MSLTDKAAALITAVRSFGTAVDDKTDDLGIDKQPLIANGLAELTSAITGRKESPPSCLMLSVKNLGFV